MKRSHNRWFPLMVFATLAAPALAGCASEASEPEVPVEELSTAVAPLRGPQPWSDETWFAPNVGSADLLNLFSEPARWARARSRVQVFQFYQPNIVFDTGCVRCENNTKSNLIAVDAYRKLRTWGIDLAIESGVIKAEHPPCSVAPWVGAALESISVVLANGGTLPRISMDEPLYGATRTDLVPGCRISLTAATDQVASYVAQLRAQHPGIRVGLVEPYPALPVGQIAQFLSALASRGVAPAYFHLDVDEDALQGPWQQEIAALRGHVDALGIPFGVLLTAPRADTSDQFYVRARQNLERYLFLGRQAHAVFQSFAVSAPGTPSERQYLPVNLPDNDAQVLSLSRLVIEGTNRLAETVGAGFQRPSPTPALAAGFSDANGFAGESTGDTLLVADLNGDRRDDLIARGHGGLLAQLSTGADFAPLAAISTEFADAGGWHLPALARSLRVADVNHDGRPDVVGYDPARGLVSALAGSGALLLPTSDVKPLFVGAGFDPGSLGWADVNGDGYGDFLLRGPGGLYVARAIGRNAYASPVLATAEFSPAGGWTAPPYAAISYADVNLDGCADVAARGAAGVFVAFASCGTATFQSARLVSTFFSDASGFGDLSFASSFQLGDVNGDGRADLVMRGGAGVWTQLTDAVGDFPFAAVLSNTFFSSANGFGHVPYRNSLRVGDPSGVGRASFIQRGGAGVWVRP